jgi:hypothetical protein
MTEKALLSGEDRTAAAAYIADLTGSLALMARRHGLDTLGYLLDMAKLEAENVKGADGAAQ